MHSFINIFGRISAHNFLFKIGHDTKWQNVWLLIKQTKLATSKEKMWIQWYVYVSLKSFQQNSCSLHETVILQQTANTTHGTLQNTAGKLQQGFLS